MLGRPRYSVMSGAPGEQVVTPTPLIDGCLTAYCEGYLPCGRWNQAAGSPVCHLRLYPLAHLPLGDQLIVRIRLSHRGGQLALRVFCYRCLYLDFIRPSCRVFPRSCERRTDFPSIFAWRPLHKYGQPQALWSTVTRDLFDHNWNKSQASRHWLGNTTKN